MATWIVKTTYLTQHDDERLAARPAHREWLGALHADGTVINAGPLADESGAVLLFRADDEAALREVLASDPYPSHSLEYHVLGEWKHLYPFA